MSYNGFVVERRELMLNNDLVKSATQFAKLAHKGQQRKYSSEPYITHPLAVAKLVNEYTDDPEVISAAILHDVVEDCDITLEQIESMFGSRVAKIVAGVTKITDGMDIQSSRKKHINNRHYASQCADCQLVKAMDSLHNLSQLHQADDAFRERFVREKKSLASMLTLAPKQAIIDLKVLCDMYDY